MAVYKTNIGVFQADSAGADYKWNIGADQTDTIAAQTYTKTFIIDSLLQAVFLKDLTTDSVLKATYIKEFSIDSILKATVAKIFIVDGYLKIITLRTFVIDSFLEVTSIKTLSVDSIVVIVSTISLTTNAVLKASLVKTFSSDAVVGYIGIVDFELDALLLASQTKVFTSDSYLLSAHIKPFLIDALLKASPIESILVDAYLLGISAGTFTSDAYLQAIFKESFDADSYLQKTSVISVALDVIVYSFEYLLKQPGLHIAELYEIELANGKTCYYTTHDDNILWGSPAVEYIAIPMNRSAILSKLNLEANSVELSLQNITGELFGAVQDNLLDASRITIKRIFWNLPYDPAYEVVLFKGIADINFDRQTLRLVNRSILDVLNVIVPRRVFQEGCNSILFDMQCKLSMAGFRYVGITTEDASDKFTLIDSHLIIYRFDFDNATGVIEIGRTITGENGNTAKILNMVYFTAETGTIWYLGLVPPNFTNNEVLTYNGNTLTVNGTPALDTNILVQGEIYIPNGVNAGQRRMIRSYTGNIITFATALPNKILDEVIYELFSGCSYTPQICNSRYNNLVRFSGFPFIPNVEHVYY